MIFKYPYTITAEDDAFIVKFLDFPNGFTQADTIESAKVFAKEMLEGLVEIQKDLGLHLPEPSEVGSLDFVNITA